MIAMTDPTSRWLSTAEAASILGVRPRMLEDWRLRDVGPPFARHSPRMVRYLLQDILDWARSNTHRPSGPPPDPERKPPDAGGAATRGET